MPNSARWSKIALAQFGRLDRLDNNVGIASNGSGADEDPPLTGAARSRCVRQTPLLSTALVANVSSIARGKSVVRERERRSQTAFERIVTCPSKN
jgi:hypothetical protein